MTGGKSSLGIRTAEPSEDDDFAEIDEGESRRTRDYILHQKRNALSVVDHANTRCRTQGICRQRPCRFSWELLMLKRCADYKELRAILSR